MALEPKRWAYIGHPETDRPPLPLFCSRKCASEAGHRHTQWITRETAKSDVLFSTADHCANCKAPLDDLSVSGHLEVAGIEKLAKDVARLRELLNATDASNVKENLEALKKRAEIIAHEIEDLRQAVPEPIVAPRPL